MRVVLPAASLLAAMLLLAGCPGSVKGVDVGAGFDAMDTQSKESKEEEKWFNSYYGKSHCVWGVGNCEGDENAGGGSSWDGGSGAADSGMSH